MTSPDRPCVAVLGGAMVADRIPVMRGLLGRVDSVLVGGAMAYTFLKADGVEVGTSPLEEDLIDPAREILAEARSARVTIHLPVDHVVAAKLAPDAETSIVGPGIEAGMTGFDIGPKTAAMFSEQILRARTMISDGPMGEFEVAPFAEGTRAVAEAMAACEGTSLIGEAALAFLAPGGQE